MNMILHELTKINPFTADLRCLFNLFVLWFNILVNNFSIIIGHSHSFLGTNLKQNLASCSRGLSKCVKTGLPACLRLSVDWGLSLGAKAFLPAYVRL